MSVLFSILTIGLSAFFIILGGCDTFNGHIEGEVAENIAPTVRFSNVPANQDSFAFAPVIYWKGSDPDGFVEFYEYADIIDSAALSQPENFIELIPEDAWVRTINTSDTVYLLTESGEITEHVFYLKCTDDRDQESPVVSHTFYRSNNPPNVPDIKWHTSSDEDYANDVVLSDTLYVLKNITDTWAGLGFNWRSSDPDDKDLYSIPLEYRYFVEKVPHDTVWEWTSRQWSSGQDLNITGLETGHYKLTVWARDDGFEISERPASLTFDVYKPSFEESILLLNCTKVKENFNPALVGLGDVLPGHAIGESYQTLLEEVSFRYPDAVYKHFPTEVDTPLFKSLLGRFRLVILVSENKSGSYAQSFATELGDYARIGGNIWAIGNYVPRNLITDATLGLAQSTFGSSVSVPADEAEFVRATSGVYDVPDLDIDTEKIGETYSKFFFDRDGNPGRYGVYPLMPGVDIIMAGSGAETVYYFKSYTDTASGDVMNDSADVVVNIGTIYYPPTPLDCLVKLYRERVSNITRVENITREEIGEVVSVTNNVGIYNETVVRVSYESGEPWAMGDSIEVDYTFLPYSDFHFRPCAIRYERLSELDDGGFEVRYRVAVFTFPLYYLDNSAESGKKVSEMFASMLDWFFLPFAH
ncbi:MAG: hypothetical protein HN757_01405 [Calditrichaeota bacterium]|nr:hypothetical protein [Calditrichota bacterium]